VSLVNSDETFTFTFKQHQDKIIQGQLGQKHGTEVFGYITKRTEKAGHDGRVEH
jgi:hypothetical protein